MHFLICYLNAIDNAKGNYERALDDYQMRFGRGCQCTGANPHCRCQDMEHSQYNRLKKIRDEYDKVYNDNIDNAIQWMKDYYSLWVWDTYGKDIINSVENQINSMFRDLYNPYFAELAIIRDAATKAGTPEERAELEALNSQLKDFFLEATERMWDPNFARKLINDRIEDQKNQFSIEDYIEDGNLDHRIKAKGMPPSPEGCCDCRGDEEGKNELDDPKPSPFPDPNSTPIILDLDGDGVETTGVKDGVYFDHDGNRFAEKTAWVGGDDALLVWDRNRNGQIDDGSELFGDNFILNNGEKAQHGFEALTEFDTNGDGIVDANDERWSELQLWQDRNGNGIVDDGELLSMEDACVALQSTNRFRISFPVLK